uniref:G-patch domain-containing protein n=1 Tax=Ascaris lumbricoides TaxID=6252 RepID=A0A9J2P2F1_ASCLU
MLPWFERRRTPWEYGCVFITIELCVGVWRLFSHGMYHAQLVRLHDILHVEMMMCISSVLMFKRFVHSSSLITLLYRVLKGQSRRVRYALRATLIVFIILSHISWTIFYLYIPDESMIAIICFICLATYLHVACFLVLFCVIEFIAIRVPLPSYLATFLRCKDKNTALCVFLSAFFVLTGLAVTRFSPVVRFSTLEFTIGLPPSFNDFSIALLTDVHIGPTVGRQRIRRIVSLTNSLQPNAVAIAGDLVDGFINRDANNALPLADLRSKYGTFYVTGNHEYYHSDVDEWLKFFTTSLNMTVLRNSNVKLYSNQGDDYLCMAGVDDFITEKLRIIDHHMDAAKALQGCGINAPTILLVHQPNGADKIIRSIDNERIDLILAGHTHGGQFYIFWPFAYLKNAYLYGLYKVKGSSTQIYVSPGVNYWGPPVKMINLCEIPVDEGVGYVKGNRSRMMAVVKFELTSSLLSIFTYFRLMTFMDVPDDIPTRQKRLQANSSNHVLRYVVAAGIIIWLLLAQMAYPLYWAGRPVQNVLFGVSLVALGVWNYVVAILFGLFCISVAINLITRLSSGRTFMKILYRWSFLRWLFGDTRAQVVFSVVVGVSLSLITFLCCNMLIVKEQVFTIRDLPKEADGIRFALISDIHVGGAVEEEHVAKIVDRVNSEAVDAVFLVGDLVDAPRPDIWRRLRPIKHLQSKFGSFYVTGNHEYYYGNALEWIEQFKAFGVHVLDNSIDGHKFDAVVALRGCDQSAPVIVLSHNPASAKDITFNSENLRVDLILSGHTHVGQFYTFAPLAFLMLPYFYGIYQISPDTRLFVSAGTLYQGPPMKMLAMVLEMSILAEPRRKQRISVDPQNIQWRDDDAKFGKKILERMGWRNGKGLGKREQGRNENLRLKANHSGKGLGCKHSYDDTWVAHHDDFAKLLASLNKTKKDTNENMASEIKQNAEKSMKSRMRIRYRGFTRGNDLSEYSEEDKCAVLGKKRRNIAEKQIECQSDFDKKRINFDEGNIVQSALSMNEYFAEKMQKFREMKKRKEDASLEYEKSR